MKLQILLFTFLVVSIISCNNSSKEFKLKKEVRWSNKNLQNVDFENSKNNSYDLTEMDTTVSPLDDFDAFANGGWKKKTVRPETEPRWGAFNILREKAREDVENIILESKSDKSKEGEAISKLYTSAMNINKINKEGISAIKKDLDKINSIKTKEELTNLFVYNVFNSISNPFYFYNGPDSKNSKMITGYVGQTGIGLPDKDYYELDKYKTIRKEYKEHLKRSLKLAGVKNISKKVESIYSFEEGLAKEFMSKLDKRDPNKTYNKKNLEELKKLCPNIKWEVYFKELGVDVNELIVSQVNYISKLNNIIEDKSLEEIKDYFTWKLLKSRMNLLSEDFVKESFYFNKTVMNGVKKMKPRNETISNVISSLLDEAIGKIYIKKHFSEGSKKRIGTMIENIRDAYAVRIKKLDWMSKETKKKALIKLKGFNYKIGYPEKWKKDYSKILLTDSYVDNVKIINRYNMESNLKKYNKPVDPTNWSMSPQTVNAYYHPLYNEIVFPAAILQPPFFYANSDDAINYGAIGAVIAHEFTHGFDDKGSKYDEKGNINNWWTKEDRIKFDAKTKVLIEQANKTEILEGYNIDGKLCLGENIADLGGVLLSYYALQNQIQRTGKNKKIDGFSQEQRLFLSWARVWRSISTDEYLKKQISTDPHSPETFRVNNPLRNLKEFEYTWGGEESDNMVLSNDAKAKIW